MIKFEREGPSLREVHEWVAGGLGVFEQNYPGEYAATVKANGFRQYQLLEGETPSFELLAAVQEEQGVRTYFGPGRESGLVLSGIAIYYQAMGPALRAGAELSTAA